MRLKKISVFLSSSTCVGAIAVLLLGLNRAFAASRGNTLSTVELTVLPLAIIFGLLLLAIKTAKMPKDHYRTLLVVMISVSFIVSVVVLLSVVARNIGWDVGVMFNAAESYVDRSAGGYGAESYLARYPNNIFIFCVIIVITKIAHVIQVDPYVIAAIINAILMFASSLLIMYSANRFFGRQGVVVSWFLSLVMIALSPWVATFYTDTVGLFFVAAIIATFLKASNTEKYRYVWFALLGILSAVGFLVKPTIIILIVALAMSYGLFMMTKQAELAGRTVKLLGVSILMFIMVIGSFQVFISNRIVDNKATVEAVQFSFDHFLAMGSLRGLPPYTMCTSGGYCTELIHDLDTRKDLRTRNERRAYHLKLLTDSVTTDFPVGYTGFVLNKLSSTFGDGSFFVWQEGANAQQYIIQEDWAVAARQFLAHNGKSINTSRYVWQIVWIAMLVLMIIALSNEFKKGVKRQKSSLWIIGFAISIVGLACYQVLFESRSRYIFLYLPVFILLATWGVSILTKRYNEQSS